MVNKAVFQTQRGERAQVTEHRNEAGGLAYKLSAKAALAQFGLTGTFNDQYYTDGNQQLQQMLELCANVDSEFIAQCAIYCRSEGFMKDMPAFMVAVLAARIEGPAKEARDAWTRRKKAFELGGKSHEDLVEMSGFAETKQKEVEEAVRIFRVAFKRVMNNATMVKKFVHILRSGVLGRKSLGSSIKNTLRTWLVNRHDSQLFRDSVGGDVTLADLIKMLHPSPTSKEREALHGYLLGKDYNMELLPGLAREYEMFKADKSNPVPNVPFQFLASLDIGTKEWTRIAMNAKWQMTRMNLNTFLRHGVLKDTKMVNMIADRLRNPKLIQDAMIFPYQLLAAYKHIDSEMPRAIVDALHDAMEIATENVPALDGRIAVACDVSGSMKWSPVTGRRKGATSAMMAIDVAALMSSVILRNNKDAIVLPFDTRLHTDSRLEPRDTVMTNAAKLSRFGGGGTYCALPLKWLNQRREKIDLVVFISDNESWIDSRHMGSGPYATETALAWKELKSRNPGMKMVCIDTAAYDTVQMYDEHGVINIGGFSDQVFKVMNMFVRNEMGGGHLVDLIEKVDLASMSLD